MIYFLFDDTVTVANPDLFLDTCKSATLPQGVTITGGTLSFTGNSRKATLNDITYQLPGYSLASGLSLDYTLKGYNIIYFIFNNIKYYLAYQGDGNIVLYRDDWVVLWASNKSPRIEALEVWQGRIIVNTNGSLVISGGSGTKSFNRQLETGLFISPTSELGVSIVLPNNSELSYLKVTKL